LIALELEPYSQLIQYILKLPMPIGQ